MKTETEVAGIAPVQDSSIQMSTAEARMRWKTSREYGAILDAQFRKADLIDQIDSYFAAKGWR